MSAKLFWFRRDLRLTDNVGLSAACSSEKPVYAVFCLDELAPLNARQRDFALGSLRALRVALGKRDVTLSLLEGAPEKAMPEAARRLGADAVHCSRAYVRTERASE